ncbi:MAG TPA: fluoride efflux transporter CrcB [Candidatus Ligilactobacillus faecavium]|nr:fluoride efflux transporter CrcB [Candidatus Ligilactobacillus faecavium]
MCIFRVCFSEQISRIAKGGKVMIWMLGLGASAGACVRYLLTNIVKAHVKGDFPLATFILNVTGALMLGLVVGIKLSSLPYAIIGTGFLGGYTTFSTFNNELFSLVKSYNYRMAVIYALTSYIIGIGFAFLGFGIGVKL